MAYVGARREVGWNESTVLTTPACYAALGRNRGKGLEIAHQGLKAAESARDAYEVITGKSCPYRARILKASLAAKKSWKEFG